MDAKQIKFLQLYENLCKLDYLKDPKIIAKFFDNMFGISYTIATDMWEYFGTIYETPIAKDKKLSKLFGDELLETFAKYDEKKTARLLNDSPVIRRTVFSYGSLTDIAFSHIVALLVAGKADDAEDILKCLVKNSSLDFGPVLKKIMEKMFQDITAKTSQPPKLSRKMEALLMSYIGKIKTSEKALLKQRVVELK